MKQKPATIFNLLLLVLEVVGMTVAIVKNGIEIMGFYTQESNLILLLACAVYLYYAMQNKPLPYWAAVFKFVATCMVTVTFVVVVLCFEPMCYPDTDYMGQLLFGGASLFHHFLCPILACVSYLAFEWEMVPGKKEAFFAMLPTLLYAIVSTSLNAARVIEGPYPFLYVYRQPVWVSALWFVAIPGGGFLFALLFAAIKRSLNKKRKASL